MELLRLLASASDQHPETVERPAGERVEPVARFDAGTHHQEHVALDSGGRQPGQMAERRHHLALAGAARVEDDGGGDVGRMPLREQVTDGCLHLPGRNSERTGGAVSRGEPDHAQGDAADRGAGRLVQDPRHHIELEAGVAEPAGKLGPGRKYERVAEKEHCHAVLM